MFTTVFLLFSACSQQMESLTPLFFLQPKTKNLTLSVLCQFYSRYIENGI